MRLSVDYQGGQRRTSGQSYQVETYLQFRRYTRCTWKLSFTYYVVAEALTNTVKHARASVVQVSVVQVHAEVSSGALRIQARDDGAGGADPGWGSGWRA